MSNAALLKFCQLAVRKQISRNAALEMYRAAGGSVRRSTFLEVWAAAVAAEAVFVPPALRRDIEAA